MATASILALEHFNLFQKGVRASAPLPSPHKDHGSGLEVQDDGEIAMPLADADLVNGYLLEVLEAGAGKTLLEVAPLDVLDHVPAHLQMTGRVLDSHVAAQFQGVALKGLGVGAPGVGKTDFGLSHHPAGRAKEAFDSTEIPIQASSRWARNGTGG